MSRQRSSFRPFQHPRRTITRYLGAIGRTGSGIRWELGDIDRGLAGNLPEPHGRELIELLDDNVAPKQRCYLRRMVLESNLRLVKNDLQRLSGADAAIIQDRKNTVRLVNLIIRTGFLQPS